MSLFRVRDFWSFDFDQLLSSFESTGEPTQQTDGFVVSAGKFDTIGAHDVFVCGNLQGLVCILQVPQERQQIYSYAGDPREEEEGQLKIGSEFAKRQLLLAQRLSFPVVDLKCGHFSSAIKQSIAVLTFDRLIIFKVRKHQVDLISSNGDATLFSHELEEHHKFELLSSELALGLIVLDSRTSKDNKKQPNPDGAQGKGTSRRVGHHQWALQLPQRDNLVVQYSNQFLFTLLESKKVVGHFELHLNGSSPTGSELNETEGSNRSAGSSVNQLAQFAGPMPMCNLHNFKGSHLVVSMSDYKIYALPMEKLLAESKQNVMKRVTLNLLQQNRDTEPKLSALSYHRDQASEGSQNLLIKLELANLADWSFELACLPLQIQELRRSMKPNSLASSQILVMSRYHLDSFSASGEHLWSQRYEAPLICMHSYNVQSVAAVLNSDSSRSPTSEEKVVTILCSDSLGGGKSNLTLLEGDRTIWSALLNSKPSALFRANLSRIPAVLVTLDSRQLSASYLGTNLDTNDTEEALEAPGSPLESLVQLDAMDSPLFVDDQDEAKEQATITRFFDKTQLKVDVRLEASNQWPKVSVEAAISVSSQLNLLLRDLSMTLEYDELLHFELDGSASQLSYGVTQIHLGHLWPDRREPFKVTGTFGIHSKQINVTQTTGFTDGDYLQTDRNSYDKNLLPKSLKVVMHFRYNDSNSGRCSVQEEFFMLPLNLVARLGHIDYSSSFEQELEDVQANLPQYKPPYHSCDLHVQTSYSDFMTFVEELVESDLVCRGLNSESADYKQQVEFSGQNRKHSTLENINLLAQSLDCRLKFKNITNTLGRQRADLVNRQLSEEQAPAIMVSIGLRLPKGSAQIIALTVAEQTNQDQQDDSELVWIQLCDLSCQESMIPEQSVRQRLSDWHWSDDLLNGEIVGQPEVSTRCPVFISIESKNPLIVLFVQNHIVERCERHFVSTGCPIRPIDERIHDAIEINFRDTKIGSVICVNKKFHKLLSELLNHYNSSLVDKHRKLKKELNQEFMKLHVSTMALLSMSKKLYNLPEEMQQYFSSLTTLSKQYQLRLFKILSDMESLYELNSEFNKLPLSSHFALMFGEKLPIDLDLLNN